MIVLMKSLRMLNKHEDEGFYDFVLVFSQIDRVWWENGVSSRRKQQNRVLFFLIEVHIRSSAWLVKREEGEFTGSPKGGHFGPKIPKIESDRPGRSDLCEKITHKFSVRSWSLIFTSLKDRLCCFYKKNFSHFSLTPNRTRVHTATSLSYLFPFLSPDSRAHTFLVFFPDFFLFLLHSLFSHPPVPTIFFFS